MSKAQILAELPKLPSDDRSEILERLWELQEKELTADHQRMVDEAIASGPARLESFSQASVRTVFRPQFWLDLEDGVVYLAEKASAEIAVSWHQEVMATVSKIERQPDLGRLRRDLRPEGIRSLVVRRYPRY